jgi:CBS domain-containing protein
MKTLSDIMVRNVITVHPDTPVVEAISILVKNQFSGLPVVDKKNVLVGIVNDYNFIVGSSSLHLPTLLQLFDRLKTYKKDHSVLKNELREILALTVFDVMNNNPIVLKIDDSIEKASQIFSQHHTVNPIPVVDEFNRVVGVVSRSDLLKFFGNSGIDIRGESEEEIERNISKFIHNFDKKFVVVSKNRTRLWLMASIFFGIVGFAIAWMIILRIT